MKFVTHTVRGPLTASVSQEEAKKALVSHKDFPKTADPESVSLEEVNGRWVASFRVAADLPPFMEGSDGGSGPDSEATKPTGEDGDNPPEDAPSDEDKPADDEPKEEKGEKAELKEVIDLVKQIAEAVGVAPNPEDSPVPGADGPPAPEAGPPGPPGGGGTGPDGKQHIVHDRALKPGEVPPGSVPVGSTSFASTQEPVNPFPDLIGKTAYFTVENTEKTSVAEATRELNDMVAPFGYRVHQANKFQTDDGQDGVRVVLTNRPPKR